MYNSVYNSDRSFWSVYHLWLLDYDDRAIESRMRNGATSPFVCLVLLFLGRCPEMEQHPFQGQSLFVCLFVCFWRNSPQWARASSFTRFINHTQRRTAIGRTPLDEWSIRRRDVYPTTHNTHNRLQCPRWGSKPQSQLASGRWFTHWTARPLGMTVTKV